MPAWLGFLKFCKKLYRFSLVFGTFKKQKLVILDKNKPHLKKYWQLQL